MARALGQTEGPGPDFRLDRGLLAETGGFEPPVEFCPTLH